MEERTGLFSNGVIWFGVAISVSEIEAGIQLASMNTLDSIWLPLVLGHIIGGILLFSTGLIGARLRLNAMETIKSTFGNYGSKFFSTLNVLQLIAWVAVLNAQGASALMGLNLPISFPLTCIILSAIIAVWVYVGLRRSSKITTIMMIVLTALLVILSVKLLGVHISNALPIQNINSTALSFWSIFEISIAMPISWLPVISDYTKDVENPVNGTLVSAIAYTIASLWMYFLGIEIVGIGTTSIAQSILLAGLGAQGVIILVLSTVTSNFVAANSAGESAKAIFNRINPKIAGVVVSAISAILAISGIMDHYIGFLYLIASVFAPMAAVLLVSFYLSKEETGNARIWYWNIFAWLAGFIVYQATVNLDSIFLGPTLLAVIVSAILAYIPILLKNKSKLPNISK
ncbi:hydroxymethylpyrimidine transporter CytX [Methanobrevibacter ruminantium M1]|uniref:Hydroxymethylpyrimidine transporter CytX n=1 Tax=Methanobrevibacter ruminantium (strain ATCC 35063 / DSM 1093 / JCM 13430 / OCM 146 / M1) TaxID=634498 RepID=D3DZ95_METRM|nr:cytosine permease [Methanobrevibacter ruminantium]ADC46050.1 hydroxymethylpyrimidine transporter CytX [Methanobrevibacter ruminantium M1]